MAGDHGHGQYGEGPWKDLPSGVSRVALVDQDGSIQSIDAIIPAFHRNFHNEQTEPLGPDETFEGDWHDFSNMPSMVILYATDAEPRGVFLEWCDDPADDANRVDAQPLRLIESEGVWTTIAIENFPIRRWMRMVVLNGPTQQSFVYCINTCPKGNFTGFFTNLTLDLPSVAPGLLTRATVNGLMPNGRFGPVNLSETGRTLTDVGEPKKKVMLLGTGLPQTVKEGPGVLHKIISTASPSILAYDGLTGTLGQFLNISMGNFQPVMDFGGIEFENGLRLVIQIGRTVTVVYS